MPVLYFADADRPAIAAVFAALHGSLTGSLRMFEDETDGAEFGPLLAEIRAELNRVDALQTNLNTKEKNDE